MANITKEDIFNVDEQAHIWSDVEDNINFNSWGLIYGNGLSMAFYNKGFSYKYLADRVMSKDSEVAILLNDIMKSNNLEGLLLKLSDTKEVVDRLKDARCPPAATALLEKYKSIQESFIKTVNDLHPESIFKLDLSNLKLFILKFRWVFTTNYDLLTYWALVHDIPFKSPPIAYDKFTDFFYKGAADAHPYYHEECGFLKRPYRTNTYYLHGALHIFNSEYNRAFKVSPGESSNLLQSIESAMQAGQIPIFVSEGDSKRKELRIQGNGYLNFCYKEIRREPIKSLLVFGQSLADNDAHLLNGILQNSSITDIWFGIYVPNIDDLDEDSIAEFMATEVESLKNRAVNALVRHGNGYLPRKINLHTYIANHLSTWLTS
ncbi:DUF4917 family protein [Deinococcus sp. 6YEL10]|uniref:DUF4917 family protein n=1 Tax=Deinococcus sp. 6YEL10 TaxID=2745870 RepID=UPI001E3AAFDD|nr:DUF4917 family protein [Deinococcus sp. 6YEL10]MCD0161397.1 DUF4917 family protein [Deinococcus sp. 6YEL10]